MNHTTAFKVFTALWAIGVVAIFCLFIIPSLQPYGTFLLIGSVVLIAAGFIIGLIFCRCPYCKKLLPLQSGAPATCPHCGKKLK